MDKFSALGVWQWTKSVKKAFEIFPISQFFGTKKATSKTEETADTEKLSRCVQESKESALKMDVDLLDKKIRRLVSKLKRHNVDLEVFDHDSIQYGEVLGQGGEGVVRKCTVMYNGVKIDAAAKTLVDNSEDAISITLDEIELLCLAHDPIINTTLKVYGVACMPDAEDDDTAHLVIITEPGIMNALQLFQKEEVPDYVTFDLFSRVAAGVYTVHSKKIIHQDLKPENILLTSIIRDEAGAIIKLNFKIIDLGMAKRVYTEKIVTDDIFGTSGYHPPEVLFEDAYDFRADVFMLGITFCVLLHSPDFLQSKDMENFLKNLHKAKKSKLVGTELFDHNVMPTLEKGISHKIEEMLCSMLENQENRDIGLLEVSELCRKESERLYKQYEKEALKRHKGMRGSSDSGFNSEDQKYKGKKGKALARPIGSPQSSPAVPARRRRRCSSRSSIASNLSEQSRRITRSSLALDTPEQSQRKTRSQSRVADNVCSDLTNVTRQLRAARMKRVRYDSDAVDFESSCPESDEEQERPNVHRGKRRTRAK